MLVSNASLVSNQYLSVGADAMNNAFNNPFKYEEYQKGEKFVELIDMNI